MFHAFNCIPVRSARNADVDKKTLYRLWYNQHMIPLFKYRVVFVATGLFLVVASMAQAQLWTPPPADFPAGNVNIPITAGSSTQWKNGRLYVNELWLSPTSTTSNAVQFPLNRGIVGLSGASGRTVLYPYSGNPWGFYVNSIRAGGGVITFLSGDTRDINNPARSSMIQMQMDGRITTRGTFVLPNTATTTYPVGSTARVPGAMVYTNGAPYFYNGSAWVPIGSGTGGGGGGAGWLLAQSADFMIPSVLYTTSTSRSVKVGINTDSPVAELDIRGDVQINNYNFDPNFASNYFYQKAETVKSTNTYLPSAVTFDSFRNDPKFVSLNYFQQTGATWETYRITLLKTGSGIGATKVCEDASLTSTDPSCSASQYDATNDPVISPNEVFELGVTSDWEGGYQLQFIKYVKTRVEGKGGGSLTVAGAFNAGSINSPRLLTLAVGWHPLRWIGSPMTVGQIRTEVNKAKGSASTNALGVVYRINLDTSAYIGPLAETELVQPGHLIVIRLTARKNITTLPAEYAPEWTLSTGGISAESLTVPNTGSVVAGTVTANTGLCLRGDCRTAWPNGGGTDVWSTSTGGIVYYNGGNVGVGTAAPGDKLSVVGSAIGVNDPDGKWGLRIGETGTSTQSRLDFGFTEQNPGTQEMLFYGGDGTNGYKMGTFAVQANNMEFRTGKDDSFKIQNSTSSTPVIFKAGEDGALVVNTNATDTIYVKDGIVGIGGPSSGPRLEVTKGDLKVSIDSSAPSGFHYVYSGAYDPFQTGTPRCTCDTQADVADLNDCGTDFYQPLDQGSFCYNYALAETRIGNNITYTASAFNYQRESDSISFTGGSGEFENNVSIGKSNAVGAVPSLSLLSGGGGKYKLGNRNGTLEFVNGNQEKKLTLGQDGAFNVGPNLLKVGVDESFSVGTNKFTMLANGNVGIGYTNPTRKLEVKGKTFIMGGLEIGNDNTGLGLYGVISLFAAPIDGTQDARDTGDEACSAVAPGATCAAISKVGLVYGDCETTDTPPRNAYCVSCQSIFKSALGKAFCVR